MEIKLIALDLDGTTINNDRVISRRNREALARAAEMGVNIVIATGRPLSALPRDVFEIEAIRYALTSNGASITDLKKNETFYENCLSPLAVEKAVELLRQYDYILEGFVRGEAYIDGDYYREVKRTGKSFRDVSYILNTRKPVENIFRFLLDHRKNIENINVNFEDLSEKPAMREKLLTLPEATITSSFDHNLEIGGATTSKAEALSRMGQLLGIEKSRMMAIGDSPNDIAMLKASGFPVAVGNAKEEVKAVAKYIAPTNHEDGVADAVEKFVLSEAADVSLLHKTTAEGNG
ncbi:MAG: HAD family hydrolase [Bacillota bacterium]|nr:HAD family hydrolase [Bacillota bacterium]